MMLSASSFAQHSEKPFSGFPSSQLQFSTYYLQYPKVRFVNPFPELGTARALGIQMGFGYYQAIKDGFGISVQAQTRIQNARLDFIETWVDPNTGDTSTFSWKNRWLMALFATPVFLEKHFILGQRHWLNLGIGAGITYFPYEAMISAISYDSYQDDTSGYSRISLFDQIPYPRFTIDYRAKLGYKFMLKSQNTLSLNLNYTYSPFNIIDAVTNRMINGDFIEAGYASQSLSYIGFELAYAYSFRKQKLEDKFIGELKPEKEEKERTNKFWVETGISFLQIRQKIKDPNPYFETAFYPQAKFNVAVEFSNKWNQRYAFSYLRYWEVDPKITLVDIPGASATGVDPTWFFSSAFGKDLIKSRKERFKIKSWIGGAISLFPYSFFDRRNSEHSGGYGYYLIDGDSLYYTNENRYPNPFNFYLTTALEVELSLFRTMKFSVTPGYTQGVLKNSISNYQYTFNGTETGDFKLISRLSHPELKFALKIPIYYGKKE